MFDKGPIRTAVFLDLLREVFQSMQTKTEKMAGMRCMGRLLLSLELVAVSFSLIYVLMWITFYSLLEYKAIFLKLCSQNKGVGLQMRFPFLYVMEGNLRTLLIFGIREFSVAVGSWKQCSSE